MKVRSSFSIEVTIIILTSVFLLSTFFSHYIFNVTFHDLEARKFIYIGMGLIGIATVLATSIVWDEILFHVRIKQLENDGVIFKNNRYKLIIQIFIYLGIPIIFLFIYFNYTVNLIHFGLWAGACLGIPLIKKIVSGINNYHDFLKLTPLEIEYKNNEITGSILIKQITFIKLIKDETLLTDKIEVGLADSTILIDLGEMELEVFFESIEDYIHKHYAHLLK